MTSPLTQAELEARAAKILQANPDPNQPVRIIYGPLANWVIDIGSFQLMLIPWTLMWWQYDRAHESWTPTGYKAGTVEFVVNGDEIEARPAQAPVTEEVPMIKVVKPTPKAAVVAAPAVEPTMFEAPILEAPTFEATVVGVKPLIWRLVFLTGPRTGEKIVMGEIVSLGREIDNQVVLMDAKVSRHHALIQQQLNANQELQGYVLVDQGSSNGTYLNGQRLSAPAPIKSGDNIRIGGSDILIQVT